MNKRYVSNDTFAQASNLVDPAEPHFDPRAFGPMGKVSERYCCLLCFCFISESQVMDSWESVRHNPLPRDILDLELVAPSQLVREKKCVVFVFSVCSLFSVLPRCPPSGTTATRVPPSGWRAARRPATSGRCCSSQRPCSHTPCTDSSSKRTPRR
jgi:hypothetical protein